MDDVVRKEWDPFRLITEVEYYNNLEKMQEFNKSIFGGLARYKGQKRSIASHKAA